MVAGNCTEKGTLTVALGLDTEVRMAAPGTGALKASQVAPAARCAGMATDRLVGVDPPGTSCEETAQSRKAPLLLLAASAGT